MGYFKIRNLTKSYQLDHGKRTVAVAIENLTIPLGGIVAIVGGSGSGKTTLLNLLGGLESIESKPENPTSLEMLLPGDSEPVQLVSGTEKGVRHKFPHSKVSYIFQEGYLLKQASLAINLSITRNAAGLQSDRSTLNSFLEQAKLNESEEEASGPEGGKKLRDRTITLSGGQQQRINIARALAREPRIVFADELSSSLDPIKAEAVLTELQTWAWGDKDPAKDTRTALQRTILWVTHDYHLAARFADAIVVLSNGATASSHDHPLEVRQLATPPTATLIEHWVVGKEQVPVTEPIDHASHPSEAKADNATQALNESRVDSAPLILANVYSGMVLSAMEAFPAANSGVSGFKSQLRRWLWPLFGFAHWVRAIQLAAILALIMIIVYGKNEVIRYFDEQLNDPTLRHVIVQQNSRELRQSVINEDSLSELSSSIRAIRDSTGKPSLGEGEDAAFGRFTELVDVYPAGDTKIAAGFVPELTLGIFDRQEPVYQGLRAHPIDEEGKGCRDTVTASPITLMPYADRLGVLVTRSYLEDFRRMYGKDLCVHPFLEFYDFSPDPVKMRVVGVIEDAPADGYDQFDALMDVDVWRTWYSGMGKPIYSSFSRAAVYFNQVNHSGVIDELEKRAFAFDKEIVSKFDRLIGTAAQLRNTFVVIAWLTLAVAATVAGGLIWGYLMQNAKSIAVLRAHDAWFWPLVSAIPFQVLLTFTYALFYLLMFAVVWNLAIAGTALPILLAEITRGAWSPTPISWEMVANTTSWITGSLLLMMLVGWLCLLLWRVFHRNLAHELRQAY